MKHGFIGIIFLAISIGASSQNIKTDWKDVQLYVFAARHSYPDTLTVCGEWFVKGTASKYEELNSIELRRIKKKVATRGCSIVYVDVKKVYTPRKGQLYILGLRKR